MDIQILAAPQEILEYCDKLLTLKREQYYLDIEKPEYNILKIAGSRVGSKHTNETKARMSLTKQGKNHPMFGKAREGKNSPMYGKIHSEETKAKMSLSQKAVDRSGKNHPMFGKTRPKPKGSGIPPQKIERLDILSSERIEYDSISAAALALGIDQSIISRYFRQNQKSPYRGRYIFKKI